jgi:nuclear pore complex protein Nup188
VNYSSYQELCATLSGQLEGTSAATLSSYLRPRVPVLKQLAEPFGKPSLESKVKLEKGTLTLPDDLEFTLNTTDMTLALAISAKFDIDQVQAFIILRSFVFNNGFTRPDLSSLDKDKEKEREAAVAEFIEALTPFYYSERLSVLRCVIPLFRANEEPGHPVNEVAEEYLPLIIGAGPAFVAHLLAGYSTMTQQSPPKSMLLDPRDSARWSKQNFKEQLVLLEILFWSLWSFVPCTGPVVVKIFEAAYQSALGTAQENSALMIDPESTQLQRDATAVWVLVMLEVLELERVASPGVVTLTSDDHALYWTSPLHLTRIHELVSTNHDGQYVCVYLAWAFVLARLAIAKTATATVPEAYQRFFESLVPAGDRTWTGGIDAVPLHMARMCLTPEAGLFPLLHELLTDSPLFVTSVAWKTGSSVTDPNAVAFRSVVKGTSSLVSSPAVSDGYTRRSAERPHRARPRRDAA